MIVYGYDSYLRYSKIYGVRVRRSVAASMSQSLITITILILRILNYENNYCDEIILIGRVRHRACTDETVPRSSHCRVAMVTGHAELTVITDSVVRAVLQEML